MITDQVSLIKKTKFFQKNFDNEKYLPDKNSIFYISPYNDYIGSYILRKISNNNKYSIFRNFKIIIKDFLYSLNYINHKIKFNNNNINYKKIFITWALDNNFNSDGSLNDRYLNINSKQIKNSLWIVIFVGTKIPKKIDDNIVLFVARTKKSLNILTLLKFFLKQLNYIFKNFFYFLFSISSYNFFSEIFLKKTKKFIKNDTKMIIMPFEGQPFQNRLINYIHNNHKNIKTIGYIHSLPLGLPTNFIYKKNGCPQKIILNGKDQNYCFKRYFGWKQSSIVLSPSFRFLISRENKKKGTIFLPIEIKNSKFLINNLIELINKKKLNIKNYEIRNHPASKNSKSNLKFIEKIKSLKKNINFSNSHNRKNNFAIFVGGGGAIIESLERGNSVMQICNINEFDSFSNKMYPNLIVKKLSKNIFEYRLKKRGNLVKFGNKKNNLKKIKDLISKLI